MSIFLHQIINLKSQVPQESWELTHTASLLVAICNYSHVPSNNHVEQHTTLISCWVCLRRYKASLTSAEKWVRGGSSPSTLRSESYLPCRSDIMCSCSMHDPEPTTNQPILLWGPFWTQLQNSVLTKGIFTKTVVPFTARISQTQGPYSWTSSSQCLYHPDQLSSSSISSTGNLRSIVNYVESSLHLTSTMATLKSPKSQLPGTITTIFSIS